MQQSLCSSKTLQIDDNSFLITFQPFYKMLIIFNHIKAILFKSQEKSVDKSIISTQAIGGLFEQVLRLPSENFL